jgi:alpha-glucosidase (family GH31 glycosyl hydrolase)
MVEVIAGMVSETGCSGWMADFAEGLPMQGVRIASGDPREFHNMYPVVWAKVNRLAAEATGKQDEMLPFHRSGFTTSPGHMTLGSLGDQLQSWDGYDGMRSAVCGMVSGGLSGYSVLHGDVGGYLSLPNPWGGERLFLSTWIPRAAAHAPCGSVSTRRTRNPRAARPPARLTATVVLPDPPL